jgi:hypothetical protein
VVVLQQVGVGMLQGDGAANHDRRCYEWHAVVLPAVVGEPYEHDVTMLRAVT